MRNAFVFHNWTFSKRVNEKSGEKIIKQLQILVIFVLLFNPFNSILVKKLVKPLFWAIALCTSLPVFSQLRMPGTKDFSADMKAVIRDYPHNYAKMRGGVQQQSPQQTDYESSMKITGAESVTISRFSADNKEVYSWSAVMLTTEEFSAAKAKYKTLFARFNNMAVKMDSGVTFYLKGKYLEPIEERGFTSSLFRFELPDMVTRKMILELSMQYEFPEWKVKVLIYERDREDTERGDIVE